ncbi:UDP-3-O-acyl-N-acetylglucosamine deacetylase [Rickettsiales bacterium]|nr:UDP-3-O-acyl-N-acetylglucosamine deacetylase [Rickettsiales bacterium]
MTNSALNIKTKNSKEFSSSNYLPKMNFAKKQRTLAGTIMFNGIGLHSGKKVEMIIRPANNNTGIVFKIKKNTNSFINIKADYKNVTSTILSTTISNQGYSISTTEHIMSALYGLNIDNVVIELTDNEVPVMDGSSQSFVHKIKSVGTIEQDDFVRSIKINRVVEVRDDDKIVRVSPHNETIITCEISFDSKFIGNQSLSLVLKPEIYETQVSSARTFGFIKDVDALRKNGLALGGSLENAIVISDKKILNKDGLRFNDEFVRHKTLDLIGDIALAGHRIIGSIYSYKAGHDLNNKLLRKIFSSDENWEFVDTY